MDKVTDQGQKENPILRRWYDLLFFLVDHVFTFTVGVMCFVHAILMVIMWVADVEPLFFFNILSVVVYTFCFVLCRIKYILPVYISIILEVTVYTVLSTYFIGLRCGTYCFLFSIVPIIIYFGCHLFKGIRRWNIVLMLMINFAVFVSLYIGFAGKEPVYDVSPVTRLVLVVVSALAMVLATIFYNTIYIFSSEHAVDVLEERNKKLSSDASEDSLTNLLNRRGFLPLVKTQMRNRSGNFCIAFFDIDDFKHVNDSFGHDAGDEVLKNLTSIVAGEMSGCDICRWGGEEIVILMKDYDLETAKEKMEQMRRHIESVPTFFFNKQIFVTVTIGLAEYDPSYSEPEALIKVADSRMYYGKQHGKNVLIFEDL